MLRINVDDDAVVTSKIVGHEYRTKVKVKSIKTQKG